MNDSKDQKAAAEPPLQCVVRPHVVAIKTGDRVVVTATTEQCFKVGDAATLTWNDGFDWWADFDERQWDDCDKSFCLQKGYTEFELMGPNGQK